MTVPRCKGRVVRNSRIFRYNENEANIYKIKIEKINQRIMEYL